MSNNNMTAPRNSPLWYWRLPAVLLLMWVSLSYTIYLYFLQPSPDVISIKRLVLAGAFGLIVPLIIVATWRFPTARALLTMNRTRALFVQAMGVCLVLWMVLPIPENYLLAPVTQLQVAVQDAPASPAVELAWFNNGLGDISFSALTPNTVEFSGQRLTTDTGLPLLPNTSGVGGFTWRGRVGHELKLLMRSETPAKITVTVGGRAYLYQINPSTNHELHITLPIQSNFAEVLNIPLILGAILFSVFFIIIVIRLFIDLLHPLRVANRLERTLLFAPSMAWIERIILVIFGLLAIVMLWIGFGNRLYADDFGYAAAFRDLGFAGAVKNSLMQMNGRFMSHIFDFGILFLGKSSIPLGPAIVLIGLGASLTFAFYHLLEDEFIGRLKMAFSFALIIMVTLLLIQPDLYEAVYWTLHALIMTGGLGLTTLAAGIFLWITQKSSKAVPVSWPGRIAGYGGLFLLGFFASGFNEAISLFALGLACAAIVDLLLHWVIYTRPVHREARLPISEIGLLLAFILGAVGGLALVVFSPGNLHRASIIGTNFSPDSVIVTFLQTVRKSFASTFFAHDGLRLLLLGILCILGFIIGWIKPHMLRFQNLHSTSLERFLLALAPFFLTLPAFLPASALGGYFPKRTLFVPLYGIAIFTFVAMLYLGSAQGRHSSIELKPTRLLTWISLFVVLIVGVGGLTFLVDFGRQMTLFASEWDIREQQIQQALADGKTTIAVRPYKHTFGTDISADRNNWLYEYMHNYYGIDFTLDQE